MLRCTLIHAVLVVAAAVPLLADGAAVTLSPGDVILNNLSTNALQQFNPAGALVHTYAATTGSLFEGAGITPGGSLVTTYRTPSPGGVDVFAAGGSQTATFTTPQVASNGADVSVFPDGTIAVNNQGPSPAVDEYTATGAFVRSIALGAGTPAGNYVAPNGTLWVVETNGRVQNFQENGTPIGSFAPTYSGLVDVVVDPNDGTLYATDYIFDQVHHYTPGGTELGNFTTNLSSLNGIGIAPDDTLYVVGASNAIDHYTGSGTLLGTIAISNSNTPLYLSVVPAVPEPASLGVLTMVSLLSLSRQRAR